MKATGPSSTICICFQIWWTKYSITCELIRKILVTTFVCGWLVTRLRNTLQCPCNIVIILHCIFSRTTAQNFILVLCCRCQNCLRNSHLFPGWSAGNPPLGLCLKFLERAGFVSRSKFPIGQSVSTGERERPLPKWIVETRFIRSFLFPRVASRKKPLFNPGICRRRRVHLFWFKICINSPQGYSYQT